MAPRRDNPLCRSAAHLSNGVLGLAVDMRLVACRRWQLWVTGGPRSTSAATAAFLRSGQSGCFRAVGGPCRLSGELPAGRAQGPEGGGRPANPRVKSGEANDTGERGRPYCFFFGPDSFIAAATSSRVFVVTFFCCFGGAGAAIYPAF